jgi:ankyrin repeat protein
MTPLQRAAKYGRREVISFLIEKGATVDLAEGVSRVYLVPYSKYILLSLPSDLLAFRSTLPSCC